MANPEHVAIVKQGAETIRQWWETHPNERLDLLEADLSGANLFKANLRSADLNRANLSKATLRQADLCEADLCEADLSGADLFGADLSATDLSDADLSRTLLRYADLSHALLLGANIDHADFKEANLYNTVLESVRGAYYASSLETVQFTPTAPSNIRARLQPQRLIAPNVVLGSHSHDAFGFEKCQRSWPEYCLDWEYLRVVGRLPLFGASYFALILIPIVFYGLALYNDQVELVRAWAEDIRTWAELTSAIPIRLANLLERLTDLALWHLHPRPIPQLSFVLLVSTFFLAMGSTCYTFACPSRVKEFSRDQWCDQLGRSLLHYWPLAWKHRYIRLICIACYALGGAGALWVLGTKLWRVLLFICKYSPYPWPWR
jgi:hypothetical protein